MAGKRGAILFAELTVNAAFGAGRHHDGARRQRMTQNKHHPHQAAKNQDNGQAEHDVRSTPHQFFHAYLHATWTAVSSW